MGGKSVVHRQAELEDLIRAHWQAKFDWEIALLAKPPVKEAAIRSLRLSLKLVRPKTKLWKRLPAPATA